MKVIREDELLAELAKLSKKDDGGLSAVEWAAKIGRNIHYTQTMLARAKKLGWLRIGKQTREALDGRTYQATVYRIITPRDSPRK